ncbi:MAG TPA: ABC transporter ATP-binding protein [Longimicrobiales bacterium]|nr:ABC transporter ATP-binding protein [Longimicrobiales bacterium]
MKLYLRILSYLAPYRGLLLAGVLATVGFAAFDAFSIVALIPLLSALFGTSPLQMAQRDSDVEGVVDQALAWIIRPDMNAQEMLLAINLFILAVFLLKNIFDFLQSYLVVKLEQSVTRDLRNQSYQHVLHLDMRFFGRTRAGQIIARLTSDADQVRNLVTKNLAKFATSALQAIIFVGIMLKFSVELTVVALVVLPAMFGIWSRFLKRIRRGDRKVLNLGGEVTSHLQETVLGIRQVKSAGAEQFEDHRFRDLTQSYFKAVVRNERVRAVAGPLTEMIGAFGTVLLLWYGSRLVLVEGTLTAEAFMVFLGLSLKLYSPVKWLTKFPSTVQPGLAAAERIFEFLDAPIDINDKPGALPFTGVRDAIRFEHVGFEYESGRPVLQDIDVTVPAGSVVALVGPSGAGKSTLADLVARFYDPILGRITIDGVDLKDFQINSLRSGLGVVSQDTILFHDTVRNNIAYGLGNIRPADIERAARTANAHEFIEHLPDGYETVLGERATRLSGGQRQRIAIARAILRDPPILILDEATSALDSESERLVQGAMEHLLTGRTVIVIAHRLSTIRHADQILVMQNGRIVQFGRHDELLAQGGLYRHLYRLQFAADDEAALRTVTGPV